MDPFKNVARHHAKCHTGIGSGGCGKAASGGEKGAMADNDGSNQPIQDGAPEGVKPTVVGIGASAGGLAALKKFFENVPAESGLVFVVVVHLSPEHPSL